MGHQEDDGAGRLLLDVRRLRRLRRRHRRLPRPLLRRVRYPQGVNPFKKDKGMLGLASKFAIAQATAIIAGFISYPFDTVRRRLQMQAEKPKEQWLYSGTLDCAVKIVKDEGMGAMFKGFGANVLRPLGGALVLVGYDEIKRVLGV